MHLIQIRTLTDRRDEINTMIRMNNEFQQAYLNADGENNERLVNKYYTIKEYSNFSSVI